MSALTLMVMWASALPAQDPVPAPYGLVHQPAYALDTVRRGPPNRYDPQPGDLVLLNSANPFWRFSYRLALSGPPTHAAIVVPMPDGELRLLEAGNGETLWVELEDIRGRLLEYPGEVYVRRRKTALDAGQCAALTDFALAVHKKRVSCLRLFGQATPLRTRGPVRTEFVGRPHGAGRVSYFCSEIVVEACVAAGLLDACTARPAATYPSDLFFDRSCNRYLDRHLDLSADWHAPALWLPLAALRSQVASEPLSKPIRAR